MSDSVVLLRWVTESFCVMLQNLKNAKQYGFFLACLFFSVIFSTSSVVLMIIFSPFCVCIWNGCRSRPVITVDVFIFLPISINISTPQCHEGHQNHQDLNCFNVTVCMRFRGRQLPGQIGDETWNILFKKQNFTLLLKWRSFAVSYLHVYMK